MTDGRTYAGWKAGLAIVGAILVTFVGLNLLAREIQPAPSRRPPSPTVITVSPS